MLDSLHISGHVIARFNQDLAEDVFGATPYNSDGIRTNNDESCKRNVEINVYAPSTCTVPTLVRRYKLLVSVDVTHGVLEVVVALAAGVRFVSNHKPR